MLSNANSSQPEHDNIKGSVKKSNISPIQEAVLAGDYVKLLDLVRNPTTLEEAISLIPQKDADFLRNAMAAGNYQDALNKVGSVKEHLSRDISKMTNGKNENR